MMQPKMLQPPNLSKSMLFLSDYFVNSDEKWVAVALYAGCIVSTGAMIGLGFILGWWCFPFLYTVFIAKDAALLSIGLGAGLLISLAMASLNYLTNAFKNDLYLNWRAWLTNKIIDQYLNNPTNYLAIQRLHPEIDTPAQRIQEDIDKLVESFLDLSIGGIENIVNLVMYTVLLSLAGGSLSFFMFGVNIVIPCYLVFVALGAGIATSAVGVYFNHGILEATQAEIVAQNNLRTDTQDLHVCAEEIAIEGGAAYYQKRLVGRVEGLYDKTAQRLAMQNRVLSFNIFNDIVQAIIPFLAAAPLYFNDLISLDGFYATSYYFSVMTRSLNWVISSFEKINKFQTSLARILALQTVLEQQQASDHIVTQIERVIERTEQQNLVVENLQLDIPGTADVVLQGLSLRFQPGAHSLIQAHSGSGKSSFFKAVAGTWSSGCGRITIPKGLETIYFLPQKPTLPHDTLRMVLAYPATDCPYDDTVLRQALTAVNLPALVDKLDENIGFKSLGEQQRIAFARVLLRKPQWVFLDEATASLDEEVEAQVYTCLKSQLPNTTLISIAHRSTVQRHHLRILFFEKDQAKNISVVESPAFSMTG